MSGNQYFRCQKVLLDRGWADNVLIEVDDHGLITSVAIDGPGPLDARATQLNGVVIPGMPNLHSHAHQRAMAGLGERASGEGDSFWTWRKAMYHTLEKIDPEQLYHIARMLYLEMLQAGYTWVAEFQYLHHDPSGSPYDNRAEMTLQCARAAQDVGIGFTALPVLYRYGGFGSQDAGDGQKRFINDADGFLEIVDCLRQGLQKDMQLGVAPHSLRAVDEGLLGTVLNAVELDRVIHIHIAEQVKEVKDCIEWSGQRPVAWLYDHFSPTDNWCLIHATHMDPAETETVARSRAIVGLCPTTEANLGDGLFNAPEYWVRNGRWGIGSDSQISVSPIEELRWLEYGQRLITKSRNVLAGDTLEAMHTGAALYRQSLQGGAAACGIQAGALAPGHRADFLVIDDSSPRLTGRSGGDLLDSMIFSGNENPVTGVYVGGKPVIVDRQHHDQVAIYENYRQTIDQLSS